MTVIATNKKARFDFEIIDKIEAGIVLTGPEIKSVRAGKVNLKGSYIGRSMQNENELFVKNMHITPFPMAHTPQDPIRDRKLLLHKKQVVRIFSVLAEKGATIVPFSLKITKRYAKLEIAIGKGRKQYDKREVLKKRTQDMDIKRSLKRY